VVLVVPEVVVVGNVVEVVGAGVEVEWVDVLAARAAVEPVEPV
jgi:hypothetical protein